MNIHGGEQQKVEGGQVFDLVMSIACALIASGFAARAVQLVEQHAPEAGAAAVGLGVVAVAMTGLSIYSFNRFIKPPSDAD